jgi:hypothetical protein
MRFIVTGRMIDQAVAPPEQEIAILKATFQLFAENRDARIKDIYPHADERATTFVIDVDTADELTEILGSIPASRLSTFQSHPVTTPETVLNLLTGWEKMLKG